MTGKEEFVTSYTPYQAEISQGVLQSIFEYQSMICQLTGMDVSNASVYDGGCAAAEAVAMCVDRRRDVAVVAESVNPQRMAVIQTYLFGSGATLVKAPLTDGKLDKDLLLEPIWTGAPPAYTWNLPTSTACGRMRRKSQTWSTPAELS